MSIIQQTTSSNIAYSIIIIVDILNSVPVLVDSALRDLDPQQLVLFIQSFGIPVDPMTKLLQTLTLNQAVKESLEASTSPY